MTTPTRLSRRSLLGLAGAGAATALLSACGQDSNQGGQAGPATIQWWHIHNTGDMLAVWQAVADQYKAAHPDVSFEITPLQNEPFKARLTTVTQAGNPPDLFHTWGGGVLRQQIEAGLVKDITDDVAPWIGTLTPASLQPYQFDGRTYAIPFDVGMVGFWYNKAMFAEAGIAAAPTTWTEYLDAVRKLKSAGVTPIALAGNDRWPGHYYWAYLSMRIAGLDALKQAAVDGAFDQPDFVAAGARLKELVDLDPFQDGFLAAGYDTPDGQAAVMGNREAAMELMGQWAPANHATLSGNAEGLGEDLGFFPFPAVEGGKGAVTDAFGGGGGFAVGKDAPAATADFLKFAVSVENQRKAAATGAILPVTKGAEDAISDPNMGVVSQALASATGFQLYLDQAYDPTVGQEVNDSVAALIAGSASPEQVASSITEVAKR